MKKKLAIGLAICLLLGIAAGGTALYYNHKPETLIDGLIPASEFAKRGHLGVNTSAADAGDPFSLIYNNQDGTKSMYVFASPVRFQDADGNWKLIDNTLTEAQNQPGYLFQNQANDIGTYYPDMQTESAFLLDYQNRKMKIDVLANSATPQKKQGVTLFGTAQEMVEYSNSKDMAVRYYSTHLGLKCQITLNRPIEENLSFAVDSTFSVDAQNDKYFIMRDEMGKTAALVYQPIIVDKNGAQLPEKTAKLTLGSQEGTRQNYVLELAPAAEKSSYPLTVELTYNFYKGNQVDSSIQSVNPNSNQYLDNYLYAGSQQAQGQAESYVRFETDYMDDFIKQNEVLSAQYHCYSLSAEAQKAELYQCDAHWTSTKITWNTKQSFETKLTDLVMGQPHFYTADVTSLVKEWPDNAVLKDNGFMIKGGQGTWTAFASADNGYMIPYLLIKVR